MAMTNEERKKALKAKIKVAEEAGDQSKCSCWDCCGNFGYQFDYFIVK